MIKDNIAERKSFYLQYNVQNFQTEGEETFTYKGKDLKADIRRTVAEFWGINEERVSLSAKPLPLPEGEFYRDALDEQEDYRKCRYLLLRWPLKNANCSPLIEADTYVCIDSSSISSFSGVSICLHPERVHPVVVEPQPLLLEALYGRLIDPQIDWETLKGFRDYFISLLEIEVPGIRVHLPAHYPENQFSLQIPGVPAELFRQRLIRAGIFCHPQKKGSTLLTFSFIPDFSIETADSILERMVPLCKELLPENLRPEDPPLPDKLDTEPSCGCGGGCSGSSSDKESGCSRCSGCGKR